MDWDYHYTMMDGKGTFGEREMTETISKFAEDRLDITKPLWRIWIITNCRFEPDSVDQVRTHNDVVKGDEEQLASCMIFCVDHAIGGEERKFNCLRLNSFIHVFFLVFVCLHLSLSLSLCVSISLTHFHSFSLLFSWCSCLHCSRRRTYVSNQTHNLLLSVLQCYIHKM